MMKKMTSLLLAVLLAVSPLAALAVDDKLDSVAMLVRVTQEEMKTLGSAVLVEYGGADYWLTPSDWLGQEDAYYYLMMENGAYALISAAAPLAETGLSVLTLGQPLDATPAPLSGAGLKAGGQSLVGYISNCTLLSSGAYHLSACALPDGSEGLTCDGVMTDVLPGAGIYDDDGALSGILLSAFGEGKGRYLGITAEGIRAALSGGASPAATPAPGANPDPDVTGRGISVTVNGGYLIIKPDSSVIAAGTPIAVYLAYEGNAYFSWFEGVMTSNTSFVSAAIPGRGVSIWVGTGSSVHGEAEFATLILSQEPITLSVPEATAMERYGYQQECYLAALPAGQSASDTERLEPAGNITGELLTDGSHDLYLQVNCSYTVEEDLEESLLICLFTPDGSVMFDVEGFLYGVDFMSQDDWHVDVTELFSDYATYMDGQLPGGEYTLSYYIGNSLSGSFTFAIYDDTVEDGSEQM